MPHDTIITPDLARASGVKDSGLSRRGGDDGRGMTVNVTGTDSQINAANQIVLPGGMYPLQNFRMIWNSFQGGFSWDQEIDQFGYVDSGFFSETPHHVYYVTWAWAWQEWNERTYDTASSLSGIFEVGLGDADAGFGPTDPPMRDRTEFPDGVVTVISHPFDTTVDPLVASGAIWFDPPLALPDMPNSMGMYAHMRPFDATFGWHVGMYVG